MNAIDVLRAHFGAARNFYQGTIADLTDAQILWHPAPVGNPIGAHMGHIVAGEDGLIQGMLRGAAPLGATTWAGRTGLSEPMPLNREWGEWGRRVRIDRAAFAAYTGAVFAATDEYLASLTESDLDRTIDLGGPTPLGAVLGIIIGNVWMHTGEISALKGLQGAKGYPA